MIGEGLQLIGLGILDKLESLATAIDYAVGRVLWRITRRYRARKLRKATELVRRNGYVLGVKDRVKVAGKTYYIGEIIHMNSMNGERAEVILIRPHEFVEIRRLEENDD